MREQTLMSLVLLFFLILLVANGLVSKKQKRLLDIRLRQHNEGILFAEMPFDIGGECYQAPVFFKMHNTGKELCEDIGEIEYIAYSEVSEYWMKKEKKNGSID
ncbi:MAG: hypothetical protein HFI66_09050 [Lachnospiraceae bacterium]|jgi:hypothetical protein|nr:hypothetical protein [Lachnospiraceae bacterium]